MTNKPLTCLLSGGGSAIPLFKVHMPDSVFGPLFRVLTSGYIGQGPAVDEFERLLQPWLGSKHILTMNSGTSALTLALRLAGVQPGDEVISTPMTCTATNVPILALGGKIVWADINPTTGNIDPESIRKKITPRTKAIMVVHWGGYPAELTPINLIAHQHGLKVIEDAAHAFGANYEDRQIGSHSDFVCFSFQAIKHLTTVDGGALTCKSPQDFERGRLLRWYGINRNGPRTDFRCEEDVKEFGYKFHMNDVCATIGIEQLKHVSSILIAHRNNAVVYHNELANVPGLRLPPRDRFRIGSYWLYTVRASRRLDFMRAMKAAGITVSQVHARNDSHTMFAESRCPLPGVDEFYSEQVSIPVGWWLTHAQLQFIVDTIRRFYA